MASPKLKVPLTVGLQKLDEWRLAQGHSQAKLAALFGVEQQSVSQWFCRRSLPHLRTQRQIEKVTGRFVCESDWMDVIKRRSRGARARLASKAA